MLEQVLTHLHNWFEVETVKGTFDIVDGELPVAVNDWQFFRIQGSVFNDGLYQAPATLVDETFTGKVSLLAIPKAVIDLANEIEEWQESYEKADSPYQSESFGGYSYSKASASTWQDVFKSRLNAWRKL